MYNNHYSNGITEEMKMLYNAALVLEGGAMRGQYSAGVTDALLKHGN